MGANWRDQWRTPLAVVFEYTSFSNQLLCDLQSALPAVSDQEDRDLLTAFTALGLDRVVAGARSLFMDDAGWDDCFLALAYGEVGELQRMIPRAAPYHVIEARMRRRMRLFSKKVPGAQIWVDDVVDEAWTTSHSVGRLLGISVEQVDLVSNYFDDDRDGFASQLTQWLQARGVNAAVVMREAQREAETELRLASRRPKSRERHAIQCAKLAATVG